MSLALETAPAAAARSWLRVRHAAPVLLVGAILAFALPFGAVSCGDVEVRTTGFQLATFSVPLGHVTRAAADAPTRQPRETTREISAEVETGGSTLALAALVAAFLGIVCGAFDLLGAPLVLAARCGLIASGVGTAALADLGLEARNHGADLKIGFWAAFAALAGAAVVQGVTWRASGGRLSELTRRGFAGGLAVAAAWAASLWWLGYPAFGNLGLGAPGALFLLGLGFGALAAAAAPAQPTRRAAFAAAAPVVVYLGDTPLVLLVLALVVAGIRRAGSRWVGAWAEDRPDSRFEGAALVALAWTVSIWIFLVVSAGAALGKPLAYRWWALAVVPAAIIGLLAGAVAPERSGRRLLFAGGAPLAVLLAIQPYLLVLVALAALATARVLERGRPRAATVAAAEPEEMPSLRVPRTQTVMVAGAAGYLLGPAIVYFDAALWDHSTFEFAKNGSFQLWTAILGAQTLLWTFALPPLLASVRLQLRRRDLRALRREVLPSAAILVLLVATIVALPFLSDRYPSVVPHMHLKVQLITAGALAMALLAASLIWFLRERVEALEGAAPTRETLALYSRLRGELDLLLAFLGGVVGLAVLGSAELRKVLMLYQNQPGVPDIRFPPEAVILYGVVLSFVLALVYVPTYAVFQRVGNGLRDRLAPFPGPDELEEAAKRRETATTLLGLRLTASTTFRIAATLLSPLIGSILGIVPKL